MGMSLSDYAKTHPVQGKEMDHQAIEDTARTYREQMEAQEAAEALKISIAQQLEQGEEPQYILYTAIKAIEILTNDQEWADEQRKRLEEVYADLAQRSFIIDNAAIAAERLGVMQQDYIAKTRKRLTQSLNSFRRLEKALTDVLKMVDDADPEKRKEAAGQDPAGGEGKSSIAQRLKYLG